MFLRCTYVCMVQEIIKLTFDCRITPVISGVKSPLLLKITPVAHFVRIQQNYGYVILYDASQKWWPRTNILDM